MLTAASQQTEVIGLEQPVAGILKETSGWEEAF